MREEIYITSEDAENMAFKAVEMLKEKHLTCSTAESCTGGLVAKLITDVPGSSEVFHCGIVSYSNDIKEKILGVKNETLAEFGAVSENTAYEMAEGVSEISGADISVSVTGMAGPTSDEPGKPVGLIFFGVRTDKKTKTYRHQTFYEDSVRNSNRIFASYTALQYIFKEAENF